MDCKTCRSLLPEYSLGHLPGRESEQVERHLLAGCVECLQVLIEVEQAWTLLADSLPAQAVPDTAAKRLQARLNQSDLATRKAPNLSGKSVSRFDVPTEVSNGDGLPHDFHSAEQSVGTNAVSQQGHDASVPARQRAFSPLSLAVAATILVALAMGMWAWLADRQHEIERLRNQSELRLKEMQRLAAEVAQANEVFENPRLRFASLRESGQATKVRGYVVWDRLSRQIHFFAFDLPALGVKRVYRIWLTRESESPLDCGTLIPTERGTGSILFDVPAEVGNAFGVTVTEEPEEGPPAPSSAPWLSTEVN